MSKDKNIPSGYNQNICQIPNIQEELFKLIKQKPGQEPNYIEFVKKFFLYIPSDYLSPEKMDLFAEFSKEAYLFFKSKPIGKRKLLITPAVVSEKASITILLLNDNKSFIVDSLNCLLVKLNLHPKFILHPTLLTVRDSAGNLVEIKNKRENTNESLVFVKILGNFDQAHINELEAQINHLMDLVDQTNEVWEDVLTEVQSCSKNILSQKDPIIISNNAPQEWQDFLNWLIKDDFTFLGFIKFNKKNTNFEQQGAYSIWQDNLNEIEDIINFSNNENNKNKLIILGRVNCLSPVHQNKLIDYILVKNLVNNEYISGTIFFGLYSIALTYQSIKNIPLLKNKMDFLLFKSGFAPKEYNYKKLALIFESFPKEAIIQINENDLYCMALNLLSSMMSHKLKLFIYQDNSASLINFLIFLPKERLNLSTQKAIIQYLKQQFFGEVVANFITEVTSNFAHLFITISIKNTPDFSLEEIENSINDISVLWDESLQEELSKQMGELQDAIDIKHLDLVFSDDYKNKYSPGEAIIDIEYLKAADNQNIPKFNLKVFNETDFRLKLYSQEPLALYTISPAIENLGFKAIDERSFVINSNSENKEKWIYEFVLQASNPIEKQPDIFKKNVEDALDKMWQGTLAIDSLSKLIGLAGLNWKEVKLIKALTRYLHQTGFIYGKGYVQLTLIKHYKFTESLITLFVAKFNPVNNSVEKATAIITQIKTFLTTITSSAEDKVLRHMLNLIEAMVRTNYYQLSNGKIKNYISFKFNSHQLLDLVRPVPYAEIFVYSNDFEAVHLRGGKVGRGGLRLSDRGEDYRTEVLGLMKAQMTKNTIIVPVGSKGGIFITISPDSYSPAEYKLQVIECYKNFLRGLLDLTDNVINGKIIFPSNTIKYDGPDPYLVVAADKGTATFSDYANDVSKEYNFWLGDAFASGGSAGYDHKKMGITAKGAWISVIRHFESLGINLQKDPITVVGIGDMSGDVFGNGLIMSKNMKLIAAFNHIHIFIDPNPDMGVSFNERLRLFVTPNTKWSDYNPQLISAGGGVYERSAKIIKLSEEAKKILDVINEEVAPDELIKAILKSKVDLIWNGGIGTYVKASSESHLEIGDKTNDTLRCNGNEIRAKVIAEGGNLGCSQLGRIEYSKKGGLINTDFIDNSGGVDCSDHEVNIKIALNHAVTSGKITLEERNNILLSMTDQIEELVLSDNYKQVQAINIASLSSAFTLEMFAELINSLEDEQLLDRVVEFLPSRGELSKRSNENGKLTRPEHAVILSYSKMSCFNGLEGAPILKDPYFEKFLFHYFPLRIREEFKEEILHHQLGNEIIRTVITNNIVNQLGGALINTLKKESGGSISDIVKSYLIVCEIFDLNQLWEKVEALDADIHHEIKMDLFTELTKIMRRGSSWFIKNLNNQQDIMEVVNEYKSPSKELSHSLSTLLIGAAKTKFEERVEKFTNAGVNIALANEIGILDSLISVLDIISISKNSPVIYQDVASIYFLIGNEFNIDWLRRECDKLIDDSYWNRLSIQSLKDDFYDKQKRLMMKITSELRNTKVDLKQWIEENRSITKYFIDFVANIKLQENININMMILANKKFEMFLRKLG